MAKTSKVDSHKLRFGSYATPRFRYGQRVSCAVRGEVIIVGLSAGRIPWPIGYVEGNSNRMLVVYRGLERAVRKDAAVAVCHWWGVTAQTVSRWRSVMGVEQATEGSRQLRAEHGKRNWPKVGKRLLSKAHDPERAAKISAAKMGKPRPPHVIEAMRVGQLKHRRRTTSSRA